MGECESGPRFQDTPPCLLTGFFMQLQLSKMVIVMVCGVDVMVCEVIECDGVR